MESAAAVAQKRRWLIDALTLCLARSRVCQVVDAATVRQVLDSASEELWREGEFRLETVWKLLCQQPGLTAKQVAPPLLLFKEQEATLEVAVRLPQALSALPRGEQSRLRAELEVDDREFARALERIRGDAEAQAATPAIAPAAEVAARRPEAPPPAVSARRPRRRRRLLLVLLLAAAAAASTAAALHFTLRSPQPFDVSDVAPLLRLDQAQQQDGTLSAVIVDPRWETSSREEQLKLATRLFEREANKGIKAVMLRDRGHRLRVVATDVGGRKVLLP